MTTLVKTIRMAALLPLVCVGAADAGVRLDIGPPGSRVSPGWLAWSVPRGDGRGPFTRRVPAAAFDSDGFSLTLGPAHAFGSRTGPDCKGPDGAVIEESVFTPAQNPMVLTISGLAAGRYRLLFWFNDSRGYRWPELKLTVTDAAGTDRTVLPAQPQTAVADSARAAKADFRIRANGIDDVVIKAAIPVVPKTYIFLSGIEVLGADTFGQALHPTPGDKAEGLPPELTLVWHPAPGAGGHRILGGGSPASMRPLTDAPLVTPSLHLAGLRFGQPFFWRVDEIFGDQTVTGRQWRFIVEQGRALSPAPADGSTDVPALPVVSWKAVRGARAYQVWAGATPAGLHRVRGPVSTPRVALPRQPWGATVFWRVDTLSDAGSVSGDTWRFEVDRGAARAPQPAHGSVGVAPDTVLSWRCPVPDANFDLWIGNAPERLERVAAELSRRRFRPRGVPGEDVFWRIDARINGKLHPSPVWHFVRGNSIVIDDFEAYDALHPLTAIWDDGRARAPRRGPVTALSTDGRNALVLDAGKGEIVLRRSLEAHPDWTVGGVTALRMRLAGRETNAPVRLRVRVVDSAGRSAEADVTAQADWFRKPLTSVARTPISTLTGVDLSRLAEFCVVARMSGNAIVEVDELKLVNEAVPPVSRSNRKGLHVGKLRGLRGAPPAPTATGDSLRELRADVCVVGGGSGGIGAALAAARKGARVIVVERESILGGTSTASGISNWEPGPGDSFAREIFERLSKVPEAVIMDKSTYDETLTRAGNGHIQFEPDKFHRIVADMLAETGCCRILYDTTFTEVTVNARDHRVIEIRAVDRDGRVTVIRAGTFIDCTGSGFLCQAAGCEVMLGVEPRSRFGEPGAPAAPAERLNAIELVYRIRPRKDPVRQELPPGVKPRRGGAAWPQPSGKRFVNSCGGLAPGWLLMEKGWTGARAELERRALAHWHWLQKEFHPEFEFDQFAPMLAIREAQRIVGEYVLTQQDLLDGIRKQPHTDIIAIADHPMDTHGAGGGLGKVAAPYGIPFRCLVPKGGWRNLLIACRGASFSHIAASSCRLSRTMIALGHAAGLAAAQSTERQCDIPDLDVAAIQKELGMPPAR